MGDPVTTALFVTAVFSVDSAQQQRKASRAQRQAIEVDKRRQQAQSARERIKQIRQARINRAQAAASATNGAGGVGSGVIGTQQNQTSQAASNIAFLDEQQNFSNQISDLNVKAAKATSNANLSSSIAGISGDIFAAQGGFDSLFKPSTSSSSTFDPNHKPPTEL